MNFIAILSDPAEGPRDQSARGLEEEMASACNVDGAQAHRDVNTNSGLIPSRKASLHLFAQHACSLLPISAQIAEDRQSFKQRLLSSIKTL